MAIELISEGFDQHEEKDLRMWDSMINGDEKAFEILYEKYVEKLYRFGFMIIPERDKVEDAIHDVFTCIWSSRNNLSPVLSVRRYLFSSLKNGLLKKLKKEKKLFYPFQDLLENSFLISPDFLEKQLEEEDRDQLSEKLQNFLLQLSARQREILYLRFYQNLSYHDIAAMLNLDQKYVYNTASTAFKKLRGIMKDKVQLLMAILLLYIYLPFDV
ncbi:MAG: sigma-70 family RNA polymerase sigma factor [Cyclobacteriaceae bacterium]|nr:sigma-70 family RNA polymerase sigma factor [Cyclobacteriaceae bacterium]